MNPLLTATLSAPTAARTPVSATVAKAAAASLPKAWQPIAPLVTPKPIFPHEGLYKQAYARNAQFARPNKIGGYQTPLLKPGQEAQFRQWVARNRVPFDPTASTVDYDMRGFFAENPKAAAAWRPGQHFPDTYKTPYDTTFSNQSKYAVKGTPFVWKGNVLIDTRTGQVIAK